MYNLFTFFFVFYSFTTKFAPSPAPTKPHANTQEKGIHKKSKYTSQYHDSLESILKYVFKYLCYFFHFYHLILRKKAVNLRLIWFIEYSTYLIPQNETT